jgi:elongation factor G
MATLETSRIRNIVLTAHSGAGKTTLADAMYYKSGAVNRRGRVDDQTSLSDYEPEEQERGSSIQMAILPCEWKEHKINVLDTPGYPDFRGDMLSAMRVADAAVLVISAPSGIEVGSVQAWQAAENAGLPRAIAVNKLDRPETDFDQIISGIQDAWGRMCVAVQAPQGSGEALSGIDDLLDRATEDIPEELLEAIAESDDDLMMMYLEGEELSGDDLRKGLKSAIAAGTVIPIFAMAADQEIGVEQFMDTVIALFPAPDDELPEGVTKDTPANLIFKTSADPFVGKVSYLRVYGAPLMPNSQLVTGAKGDAERVAQVYSAVGKELNIVDRAVRGDIAAVTRLQEASTYDTLCSRENMAELEGAELPIPIFALAVSPESQSDLDKMASSLTRITEEDPTLRLERNAETGELVLHGLGDIHVEMAIQRIARKFEVALKTSLPKIAYRETIVGNAAVDYKHKKQSGGSGQYGHVLMRVAPAGHDAGITFSSSVVGGNVPREYIPSVEKGVRNAAAQGVLAGFPVVGIDVELYDGSSHSVDSSGVAFEIAGSMGFKQAMRDARPQLLEPVLKVDVMVPDETAGDVMGDLNRKRARISGMEPLGNGFTVVNAEAPISTMQRYAADLRSLTQARGSFNVRVDHYEAVPAQDTNRVIAQYADDNRR